MLAAIVRPGLMPSTSSYSTIAFFQIGPMKIGVGSLRSDEAEVPLVDELYDRADVLHGLLAGWVGQREGLCRMAHRRFRLYVFNLMRPSYVARWRRTYSRDAMRHASS